MVEILAYPPKRQNMMEYIAGKHDSWEGPFRQSPRYRNGASMVHGSIGALGAKWRDRERGVPASSALQCVRTQQVVAARSSGVGRRNLDRRAPEERSMYDHKLGRSEPVAVVGKSAIKVGPVRSMTELMMCVHQKAARPF